MIIVFVFGGIGIFLLLAQYLIPFIVVAIGFGAGGIAASSTAAWIMSWYGGSVTVASICAILQSIGATSTIGAMAAYITTIVGGVFVMAAGLLTFFEDVPRVAF